MTAERVLQILDTLRSAGVTATVDGGWGVDALVGRETRPHEDLDLVVALGDVDAIRSAIFVVWPSYVVLATCRLRI